MIPKIKAALINIPYDVFDKHGNCGEWCKNNLEKEDYVDIRLKNSQSVVAAYLKYQGLLLI